MPSRKIHIHNGVPYPLAVFRSRYGGTYERGDWLAITSLDIPDDAHGDDISCAMFWDQVWAAEGVLLRGLGYMPIVFGRGATPDEAIQDCKRRAEAYNESQSRKDTDT